MHFLDLAPIRSVAGTVKLPGSWTLAPGQSQNIAIAASKTQKGVLDHRIIITSNDTELPV